MDLMKKGVREFEKEKDEMVGDLSRAQAISITLCMWDYLMN
jgi:hypothetical protein